MNMYLCNLCGAENTAAPEATKAPPGPLCSGCRASVRFRAIGYVMSRHVFGGDGTLFRGPPTALRGVGLSDAPPYARAIAAMSDYTNTYYHQEPRLDIMEHSEAYNDLDFLVSSDVFEHTPPPTLPAYVNARAMLRLGGKLVLSVPTGPAHVEHFPDLHDYALIEENGDYRLENTTLTGEKQVFEDLRFHGGPGSTLEMRIYSVEQVEQNLHAAGFAQIKRLALDVPEYGIMPLTGLSTLWVASK